MAMSADTDPGAGDRGTAGERLPCGRTLEEVWAARDGEAPAGHPPHAADCPHCRAALDRLGVLDAFVRTARTAEARARTAGAEAATGRAAEAVTARVMGIVRRELRPGRSLPLGDADEDAWIVEAAAAKAFRAAADALPGVRAGSCRIVPLDPAARPGARGPLRVRLQVAADLSRRMPEVAEEIRDRIEAAADAEIGLDVRAVDVTFVDLVDPDDAEGAGPA